MQIATSQRVGDNSRVDTGAHQLLPLRTLTPHGFRWPCPSGGRGRVAPFLAAAACLLLAGCMTAGGVKTASTYDLCTSRAADAAARQAMMAELERRGVGEHSCLQAQAEAERVNAYRARTLGTLGAAYSAQGAFRPVR